MDDLLFARSQMAVSLAFHIIFAAVGMGMPLLMALAEWRWLRTRDPAWLDLARRWSKGTAILFAVGAVSGTVLSFELGLLWPGFMRYAGSVISMPFSLEGFAFFAEAIFLGVYLYGWDRISPRAHWIAGVIVAVSGIASGAFVVTANAWMNTPAGFRMTPNGPVDIDPIAAMLNPAALHQVIHMVLAAYVATGFAVAGVHAFFLHRDRTNRFHRRALSIALAVACIATPLQILSGDLAAKRVAHLQPIKFAAMEGLYKTASGAHFTVGGIADNETMTTRYGIEIPYLLSFLQNFDPNSTVRGLEEFPRETWPNTTLVHFAFDAMIACGMAMLGVVLWCAWRWWRTRSLPDTPRLLRTLVWCAPLGFIAIETGWCVTELGRQPWTIYNVMRTAEAVTPITGLAVPFAGFTLLYLLLSGVLVYLLRRVFLSTPKPIEEVSHVS